MNKQKIKAIINNAEYFVLRCCPKRASNVLRFFTNIAEYNLSISSWATYFL